MLYHFLSRVIILTRDIDTATRDIDIAIVSRPTVRHIPVLDENGLTYFHSFFTIR